MRKKLYIRKNFTGRSFEGKPETVYGWDRVKNPQNKRGGELPSQTCSPGSGRTCTAPRRFLVSKQRKSISGSKPESSKLMSDLVTQDKLENAIGFGCLFIL